MPRIEGKVVDILIAADSNFSQMPVSNYQTSGLSTKKCKMKDGLNAYSYIKLPDPKSA